MIVLVKRFDYFSVVSSESVNRHMHASISHLGLANPRDRLVVALLFFGKGSVVILVSRVFTRPNAFGPLEKF